MILLFIIEFLIFVTLTCLAWFLVGRHIVNYLSRLLSPKDPHAISEAEFKKKIAVLESRVKELEKAEKKDENLAELGKLHKELEDLNHLLGNIKKPS